MCVVQYYIIYYRYQYIQFPNSVYAIAQSKFVISINFKRQFVIIYQLIVRSYKFMKKRNTNERYTDFYHSTAAIKYVTYFLF